MPDELTHTLTLPVSDWQIIIAGLLELPMKHSANTFNRVQQAIAAEQKPERAIPHLVEGADG